MNEWYILLFVLISTILTSLMASNLKAFESVAIIGGGLAGLSSAHRLQHAAKHITVFDVLAPGCGGASAVSAGLMHPMTPRGSIIWNGDKGYALSIQILNEVQKHSSYKIFDNQIELKRPIISAEDYENWNQSAKKYPEYVSMGSNEYESRVEYPFIAKIKNSAIVNCPLYLQELWRVIQSECKESGGSAKWEYRKVDCLEEISENYELVILSCGADIYRLCSNAHHKITLDLKLVKGQNVFYNVESNDLSKTALLRGEYIVPRWSYPDSSQLRTGLIGGATHEHLKSSEYYMIHDQKPNLEIAQTLLNDKLQRLFNIFQPTDSTINPTASHSEMGIRVVTNRSQYGRLPFAGRLPNYSNVWAISGFGSRGLIHHALISKYLTDAILQDDDSVIPYEIQIPLQHSVIES